MLKHEVEIEIKNNKRTVDQFKNIIYYVYRNLVANLLPMSEGNTAIFTMEERRYAVAMHNEMFRQDIFRSKWNTDDNYMMFDFKYNKPKNIKMENLQPELNTTGYFTFNLKSSFPTIKSNGTRRFLLITKGIVWLTMPPFTVAKFGTISTPEYDGRLCWGKMEKSLNIYIVYLR